MTTTHDYVQAIRNSGLTIYDSIDIGDPDLWIPTPELEQILNQQLRGISLENLPNRTRSKTVNGLICKALGYPIPSTFKKTKPRFLGQNFDKYVQKTNNLQIWNQKIETNRRYVIIPLDKNDYIVKVRVVRGDTLSLLDTKGTLTKKYQAILTLGTDFEELIINKDTNLLTPFTNNNVNLASISDPTNCPNAGELLPIACLFEKLKSLVGKSFPDPGSNQERNRGAELHRLVCSHLGYQNYHDNGQFPDIRHQLLEVKLQTSPTIDLGLVLPNSIDALDVPKINNKQIRHCDIRYALFYAETDSKKVTLTHFCLMTGESFFSRFNQCQGKKLNEKIQIYLPSNFFDS